MSNAEMPPLACSQVWMLPNGPVTVLIGDFDEIANARLMAEANATRLRWRDTMPNANIIAALKRANARLIHGPGAPWSPTEERSDARD